MKSAFESGQNIMDRQKFLQISQKLSTLFNQKSLEFTECHVALRNYLSPSTWIPT